MQKNLLKGLIVLYYILIIYFSFFQPFSLQLYVYSDFLAIIILIMFLFLLCLPFLLSKWFKFDSFHAILYSLIFSILYCILLLFIGYILSNWFKDFSYFKWNNSSYCDMRYNMVDSLNKKYDFIGMSKEKVYSILGDPNKNVCEYDYEENNKICYSINSDYMSNDFYCLSFDNYNLVLKIEKVSVK